MGLRSVSAAAALAAVSAIAACGSESGADLARPQIDTLPGGAVSVRNAGPSGWADTNGWHLVETGRMLASDSGATALVNPMGAVVDGAGRVYVVDQSPTAIKVFDRAGTFVRTIGREGDGPGEYRSPILGIHGPHLIVHDPRLARLTVFDTAGSVVASWRSACCHYRDISVDTAGRIMVATTSETRPEFSAAFLRFSVGGRFVDTVWVPKGGELKFWEVERKDGRMRMMVPFTAWDIAAFTPDGMLAHAWSGEYRYVVLRSSSDTVRVVSLASTPVERPESERRAVFDQLVKSTAESWGAAAINRAFRFEDIPATAMPMSGLEIDPAGYAWVSVYAGDTLHVTYDIFDPAGAYLGRLAAPWRAGSAHVQWHGVDELLTIGEDEEGVPELVRYRVDKSAVPRR